MINYDGLVVKSYRIGRLIAMVTVNEFAGGYVFFSIEVVSALFKKANFIATGDSQGRQTSW